MRPGHTWREPGGGTNSLVSDSVRLEPRPDKSAIEVATVVLSAQRVILEYITYFGQRVNCGSSCMNVNKNENKSSPLISNGVSATSQSGDTPFRSQWN